MEFQRANYKDLGGGDLQDEVYGAHFLAAPAMSTQRSWHYRDLRRIHGMIAIGRTPDVWAASSNFLASLTGSRNRSTKSLRCSNTISHPGRSREGSPL